MNVDDSGARTGDLMRFFADAPLWRSAFLLLPVVLGCSVMLDAMVEVIRTAWGWGIAMAACGLVLLAAGVVAALVTTLAKWVLVGRFTASRHPLWSSFVWRNELFDVFYEVLGVPLFAGPFLGTPVFNAWARTLGVKIGKGVWLESHWLPETDLIRLDDGVTVNRGCVLQTHLFHDRILRTDTVVLREGATLGPGGIVLPGSTIGARTTLGPASLVMAAESVPDDTRWLGNPIEAWRP